MVTAYQNGILMWGTTSQVEMGGILCTILHGVFRGNVNVFFLQPCVLPPTVVPRQGQISFFGSPLGPYTIPN